jgi:energy-coupling factor transporter transmembrane protein EcfT
MPDWLREPNPPLPSAKKVQAPWFERTLLKMRATAAKTIGAETIARSSGLLQSIHPTAKAVGFLCALVATAMATSLDLLAGVLALIVLAAFLSRVPLGSFLGRVAAAVAFFGLVVAVPVALQAGLASAATILLRLGTGIALAQLWTLTTPWHCLLRSLGSLGVPRTVLASATLTYRYLFVMLETLGDMVEARTARQVGAWSKRQARTYAGTGSAVLFAKSYALAEETHLAMQARGFDGTIQRRKTAKWNFADAAAALAGAGFLAVVLLQGAFHAL